MSKKGKNISQKESNSWYVFPTVLTIVLFAINVGIYFLDLYAGFALSFCLILYAAVFFYWYLHQREKISRRMLQLAAGNGQIQKKLLKELSSPYALLDESGDVVWMNESFQQVIHKEESYHKSLALVLPELSPEAFPKESEKSVVPVLFDDRIFRAELYKINMDYEQTEELPQPEDPGHPKHVLESFRGDLIVVNLYDETELQSYKQEVLAQKMVAGVLYLDNYDDAMEKIEEVRQSLLLALLDRRINKYFSDYDAIVRKVEADKYFIVMNYRAFDRMCQDKFSLLQSIKNVNIGNDMAVTLSMGFGLQSDSFLQNYAYARAAIDLALGRGGDQVVVKTPEDNRYYGGKSKQIERNTRVKARVKAQALREIMEANGTVFIMGHTIGDADSFGAAIGLYRAAKSINRRAYIVINEVTSAIKTLKEKFQNNSDYEPDMFIDSDRALELVTPESTVIVVDVSTPARCECTLLLSCTSNIVVFDHHRQSKDVIKNAVLAYIEPYASSTCEMIAEILQYFDDSIKLKNIEADSIYAGIMIDTNNFVRKTGVRTFEAAAYLRRCGADVSRVRKLFREDMATYKARAAMISNTEVYRDRFAIGTCPEEGLDSPTVVAAQAANELLNVIGIKASFVLTPFKSKIYISARSVDEINVQVVMERLGGGGHLNVAGAQLSCTMEEAKEKIRQTLDQMIEEGDL